MRVTVKQVAEAAGVSRGTVDKVVHNRPGVSEKVRLKVKETIEKLGYMPNKAARALLSSRHESVLAVLIPTLENPFFVSIKKGMDKAAQTFKDYGMKLEYYYCDAFDLEKLHSILNYLESRDIQGLIVRGTQDKTLADLLNNFIKKNIPVITYDSDIPNINRLCFIGENNLHSGRVAASLMSKSIQKKGQVAVLLGSNNILSHKLRAKGFVDYLSENYPSIEVVSVTQTFEQEVIAFEKTKKLLENYTEIKGIFNAAGCSSEVARATNLSPRKDEITLITYNFTPDIVTSLKNKTIDYTIGLSPFKQGYLTVQTLCNYIFFNETPEQSTLNVQINIALDENIDTLIQQDEENAL